MPPSVIALAEPLHLAPLRLGRPEHAWPDTEPIIDGYPRSANAFLEGCVRRAWDEDLRIALHTHVSDPLRAAARGGLPAILPFWAPMPAAPPPIAVIGNLPRPVTGSAAVTKAVADNAATYGPVRRLSLSPGGARGPLRHPRRARSRFPSTVPRSTTQRSPIRSCL